MSYSQLYFGKELHDLSYQDIEDFFIQPRDESDKIEFKSYHNPNEKNDGERENGVIRAICGFLNSAGGIVIWGAPVGTVVSGKKEKFFINPLSPVNKLYEKDNFISRITDLITPSPTGIRFSRVEKNGGYLYLFEVDKSDYSPHQFRNIYYMRIDGQTRPAPHYFIEALFRKISFPQLEGYLKFESFKKDQDRCILKIASVILNKSKIQNEQDVSYRILISKGYFLGNDFAQKMYSSSKNELRNSNAKSTLYFGEIFFESEIIAFDKNAFEETSCMCDILFYFGGKTSPLIFSHYKFNFDNRIDQDINSRLFVVEENVYVYKREDNITSSHEQRIRDILGR